MKREREKEEKEEKEHDLDLDLPSISVDYTSKKKSFRLHRIASTRSLIIKPLSPRNAQHSSMKTMSTKAKRKCRCRQHTIEGVFVCFF